MNEDIDLLPGNGQFKVEAIPKEQGGAGEEDDRKRAERGNRRAFECSLGNLHFAHNFSPRRNSRLKTLWVGGGFTAEDGY